MSKKSFSKSILKNTFGYQWIVHHKVISLLIVLLSMFSSSFIVTIFVGQYIDSTARYKIPNASHSVLTSDGKFLVSSGYYGWEIRSTDDWLIIKSDLMDASAKSTYPYNDGFANFISSDNRFIGIYTFNMSPLAATTCTIYTTEDFSVAFNKTINFYEYIYKIAFSPNSKYFCIQTSDLFIILDTLDWTNILEFYTKTWGTFSPDDSYLALGHEENWQVYDMNDMSIVINSTREVKSFYWSPNTDFLLVSYYETEEPITWEVYRTSDWSIVMNDTKWDSSFVFSPDGAYLVRFYDRVPPMAYDDQYFYYLNENNGFTVYNTDTWGVVLKRETGEDFSVEFSQDNEFLAVFGLIGNGTERTRERQLIVWGTVTHLTKTFKPIDGLDTPIQYYGHLHTGGKMLFSPDNRYLLWNTWYYTLEDDLYSKTCVITTDSWEPDILTSHYLYDWDFLANSEYLLLIQSNNIRIITLQDKTTLRYLVNGDHRFRGIISFNEDHIILESERFGGNDQYFHIWQNWNTFDVQDFVFNTMHWITIAIGLVFGASLMMGLVISLRNIKIKYFHRENEM
ncbi:MAG: hypothetical protein ACFFDT_03490 [Candidatus Hodarchaeota archaeon]